jgi:hypothetical protein
MIRREGRYQYQTEARQPRMVRGEMAIRCADAVARRYHELAPTELRTLQLIIEAGESGILVTKADIDRANGILGRLNANG